LCPPRYAARIVLTVLPMPVIADTDSWVAAWMPAIWPETIQAGTADAAAARDAR
jgi:hypothetical protein